MLEINLPWFNPVLNPNKRAHYMVKANAVKKQRGDAKLLTSGLKLPKADSYTLELFFAPPNNRRIDTDNCLAATKSYIDGIADGLGINDRLFKKVVIHRLLPVKGGDILVRITPNNGL